MEGWLLSIRSVSVVIPDMVTPFYFILTSSYLSDSATIRRPFHSTRPHLTQSTFTPINYFSVASDRNLYLDRRQALIAYKNTVSENSKFAAIIFFCNFSKYPVETIIRQHPDLVEKLRDETLQRRQQRLKLRRFKARSVNVRVVQYQVCRTCRVFL